MEALNPGDKKRVLPTWMTAQVPEKRMVPGKSPKRRRTPAEPAAAASPSRRCSCIQLGARQARPGGLFDLLTSSRLPTAKTVYCMSEAELVDVALGVLIESRKQEELPLAGTDKPELSPVCSEGLSSPGGSEEGGYGKGALPPGLGPSPPEPACPGRPEEDDAFKYVREIFFS
ncbi:cell cycle regulator of non-homologous end joining isoform 1-T6 [Molossus nigricans]